MRSIVIVLVGLMCGLAVWKRDVIVDVATSIFSGEEISETEIVKAEKELRQLLESGQNSFIHRQEENRRMARSIDELGDGVNDVSGCVISAEVWYSRVGGEGDLSKIDKEQRDRVNRLPFRYAILPMRGVNGDRADDLSCLILALPQNTNAIPALAEVVGPLKSDPGDFHKAWPIFRIRNMRNIAEIWNYVLNKKPCDRILLDMIKEPANH